MSAHAGVMNRSSRKTADAIDILVFRAAPSRIHSARGIKVPRSASTVAILEVDDPSTKLPGHHHLMDLRISARLFSSGIQKPSKSPVDVTTPTRSAKKKRIKRWSV